MLAPSGTRLKFAFGVVMALWMLLPVVLWERVGTDTRHFFVADELVRTDPASVYPPPGDPFGVQPAFFDRACSLLPRDFDCAQWVWNFNGPPPALVLGRIVSWRDVETATFLIRLLSATGLVAGMVMLWRRLAGRSAQAPYHLVVAAIMLTPSAIDVIGLGQTSSLMFASACLGVASGRRTRDAFGALLFALSVAFKFSPIPLVVVLVLQRRWRVLAWSGLFAVVLVAATAAIGPFDLYPAFVRSLIDAARAAPDYPHSVSLDRLVDGFPSGIRHPVGTGLRFGTFAAGAYFVIRRVRGDSQWALAWAVIMLVNPFTWWNYYWVGIAAVAVILSERTDRTDTTPVVVVAGAMLAVQIINVSVLRPIFLLGCVGYACALARGHGAKSLQSPASLQSPTSSAAGS